MYGYANKQDFRIKSINFGREKIKLSLNDGRIISAPVSRFPGIKKLSSEQRKKYHIIAGLGFDFDDSDEVYHLGDFLGIDFFNAVENQLLSEPVVKYKAIKRKGK